jgi:hypothetical protein
VIAHSADRYSPGDSQGIVNTSTADLPRVSAGPGQFLVPVLILLAVLFFMGRR